MYLKNIDITYHLQKNFYKSYTRYYYMLFTNGIA